MNTTPQDGQDAPAPAVSPEPGAVWDHAAILTHLGGPTEAVAHIAATGLPAPAIPTVWMWRSRSRVPSRWMPCVLLALARKGVFLHDLLLLADGTRALAPAAPPAMRDTGSA